MRWAGIRFFAVNAGTSFGDTAAYFPAYRTGEAAVA